MSYRELFNTVGAVRAGHFVDDGFGSIEDIWEIESLKEFTNSIYFFVIDGVPRHIEKSQYRLKSRIREYVFAYDKASMIARGGSTRQGDPGTAKTDSVKFRINRLIFSIVKFGKFSQRVDLYVLPCSTFVETLPGGYSFEISISDNIKKSLINDFKEALW